MSVLPFATAPYMLRSTYKDQYLVETLISEPLGALASSVFGARFANHHDTKIASMATLLYYVASGLVGGQTIGEEFCDLVAVSGSSRVVPITRLRRLWLTLLITFQTPLLNAFANVAFPNYATTDVVGVVRKLFTSLFFITDVYVSIPHRFAFTQYVSTQRHSPQSPSSKPGSYAKYGLLQLLELLLRWWQFRKQRRQQRNGDEEAQEENREDSADENDDGNGATGHCTLCLGTRKTPTATSCGHIFCWTCISAWVRSNGNQAVCPLCRQRIELRSLVPLVQYRAPQGT